MPSAIPTIPGELLADTHMALLRRQVASILGRRVDEFPGAQPVSFATHHLDQLRQRDFFVCEKSDGVRCLMFITSEPDRDPSRPCREVVYLIDRKNHYYQVPRLHFPLPDDPTCKTFHDRTILDGELVIDTEADGSQVMRYLVFDCLVINGKNLIKRDYSKRLGHVQNLLLKPLQKFLKANLTFSRDMPFRVEFKEMQFAYGLSLLFNKLLPELKHGNDGLIFTSWDAPYVFATNENILKWKPAEENSIDFQLRLAFNKFPDGSNDYNSRPSFELYVWKGGDSYEYWADLPLSDAQFQELVAQGRPLNERTVECALKDGRWTMLRFRDDKEQGNHITTVKKVLQSIRDGVTKEQLVAKEADIRNAWKSEEREEFRKK
ncbi:mRNA-capping enzyme subunit alpha [Neolecta irregularis DAH-3]|uniref:mRNA-capping enzyme subunit alpha n=1 Tax=Neolecta irregularis (strain DAH-3) TaxID=1198029 RepID=A0A1U7LT34_NEOID|nr:mRNA-capping enzyme subunit alpha [Neolecta irregularis DAH-3]|eukprot:OLL25789.1 mRNA-capping enzyme subunit alpha [Neolecta irregularis DAH-3]